MDTNRRRATDIDDEAAADTARADNHGGASWADIHGRAMRRPLARRPITKRITEVDNAGAIPEPARADVGTAPRAAPPIVALPIPADRRPTDGGDAEQDEDAALRHSDAGECPRRLAGHRQRGFGRPVILPAAPRHRIRDADRHTQNGSENKNRSGEGAFHRGRVWPINKQKETPPFRSSSPISGGMPVTSPTPPRKCHQSRDQLTKATHKRLCRYSATATANSASMYQRHVSAPCISARGDAVAQGQDAPSLGTRSPYSSDIHDLSDITHARVEADSVRQPTRQPRPNK